MPLVLPVVQAQLVNAIKEQLKASYAADNATASAYTPEAEAAHIKLATAIGMAVGQVIVQQLQTQAIVLPGIATAGSPASHVSVTPGRIG